LISSKAGIGNMKLNLALAAITPGLAGRSSTPTEVNAGVLHARMFNFVCWRSQPEPGFVDNWETVRE